MPETLVPKPATHQEDVVDGVQYYQDCLGVLHLQQVQDGLQSAAVNQLDHLLNRAPAGQVGDGPHRLTLGLKVPLRGPQETRRNMTHRTDSRR